jgi:uncharacterized protein YutD
LIVIGGKGYELMLDHKDGWNPEAFRGRYSEVLERYDFIVGDWGYSQLRLKGFYRDNHPKVNRDTAISGMVDYINEYCNFGCAYFVLHKLKEQPKEGTYKDILIKEPQAPTLEEQPSEEMPQETAVRQGAASTKEQTNREKDKQASNASPKEQSGRESNGRERTVREHQSKNHRGKDGQGKRPGRERDRDRDRDFQGKREGQQQAGQTSQGAPAPQPSPNTQNPQDPQA